MTIVNEDRSTRAGRRGSTKRTDAAPAAPAATPFAGCVFPDAGLAGAPFLPIPAPGASRSAGEFGGKAARVLGGKAAGELGASAVTTRVAGSPARGVANASTEDLLARYRRKPTTSLRNELIERHRADVESIARGMALRLPRSVDVDDLVHAGLWGLVQAIDKFRADRGAPFRPFMRPRVRGAMLDELRNMDFLPRLYRQRARELEAATVRLRSRLGREPIDAELAAELGITEARLQTSYSRLRGLIAREPVRDGAADDGDPFDRLADEEVESPLDALNRQDLLAKIEATLQPIEWMVLRMHYLDGLSGKEVAARLRLSAARICQIHLRVLSRLKTRFASLSL